jgi:hypothetical protein
LHQKQIRFFTILGGGFMVLLVVVVLWLLNRSHPTGN